MFSQTNINNVSRAAFENLLKDRSRANMGLTGCYGAKLQ